MVLYSNLHNKACVFRRYNELKIYMLFAGWEGSIFKTEVTVFHHTDRPLAGK